MIDVRLSHSEKAESPTAVTLGGMVIDVRLEHQENAESPMVVTLGGMVMETRLLHPQYLYIVLYQRFMH